MIAGIRNSGVEKHIFRHNDPDDLTRILATSPAERPKLVCFESVCSMDGDVAPFARSCCEIRARVPLCFMSAQSAS